MGTTLSARGHPIERRADRRRGRGEVLTMSPSGQQLARRGLDRIRLSGDRDRDWSCHRRGQLVSARHALGKTSEHAAGHDVVGRGDQGSVGIVEPPRLHAAPVPDQYPRAAVVGIQGECPDPVECRAETDVPSGREMGA